ncbi:hypothetical protein J6590_026332, partial [Homalodisca vitripennis]
PLGVTDKTNSTRSLAVKVGNKFAALIVGEVAEDNAMFQHPGGLTAIFDESQRQGIFVQTTPSSYTNHKKTPSASWKIAPFVRISISDQQ